MPLPPLVAQAASETLDAFCVKRIPAHVRDTIRLVHSTRGNTITLTEERDEGFRGPTRMDIARFKFRPVTGTWHLYWADQHNRWHLYEDAPPTAYIRTLIEELDRDPTGIFWG